MKKVLITGACGFIGSHLTEICVKKGFDVVAFDRYNSNNSWGWLEKSKIKNEIQVVLGDIRDYDSVLTSMKDCNIVFHLAALIGIPYSYISPLAYLKTNIEGTYNILENARNLNIEQTLICSTSEVYGSAQYCPIDELHPLNAQSPYSASKIGADNLALSYFKSFDLPLKIVRPFNTYGPRQSARAIIPTVIGQLLNNNEIIELGNIYPERDFNYVLDTCEAFIDIFKTNSLFGEVTNIGTNKSISIENLVRLIAEIMNTNYKIEELPERTRNNLSEVDKLICDNSKIVTKTKWTPKTSLEEGISNVIQWMKKTNNNFYKHGIYNV